MPVFDALSMVTENRPSLVVGAGGVVAPTDFSSAPQCSEAQLFDNIIIIRPMDLLQYLYLRMLHID